MNKRLLAVLSLLAASAGFAQQSAPAPVCVLPASFWPLHPYTHTVYFGGHSHLKGETPAQSAQHVRRWLTAYFASWEEFNSGHPSKLTFVVRMRGLHDGVELRGVLGAKLEADGFRFILTQFTVGAPSGQGIMFWHPLHKLLDDPDFRPDINQFQQELAQALPNL